MNNKKKLYGFGDYLPGILQTAGGVGITAAGILGAPFTAGATLPTIATGMGMAASGVGNISATSNTLRDEEEYNRNSRRISLMNNMHIDPSNSNLNNIPVYAMGGQLGSNQLTEFNGPTHQEGGIQLRQDAEVEGGETKLNSDNYIFSDRLLLPESKKTFADESKRINKKYSKRENDSISEKAKKKELTRLMNQQEAEKQMFANPVSAGGNNKFAGGGFMNLDGPSLEDPPKAFKDQRVDKFSAVRGYEIPDNFNLNLFLDYMGKEVPDYNFGKPGLYGPRYQNAWNTYGEQYTQNLNALNALTIDNLSLKDVPTRPPTKTIADVNLNPPSNSSTNQVIPEESVTNQRNSFRENIGEFMDNPEKMQSLRSGASLASALSSNLYDLISAKPRNVNLPRITPQLISNEQERNELRRQEAIARGMAKGASRNATTTGQYLSNINAANANIQGAAGAQASQSFNREQNINSQIRNQAELTNANISMQEQELRAKEADAAQQARQAALAGISTNLQGYSRDEGQRQMQKEALRFVGTEDRTVVNYKGSNYEGHKVGPRGLFFTDNKDNTHYKIDGKNVNEKQWKDYIKEYNESLRFESYTDSQNNEEITTSYPLDDENPFADVNKKHQHLNFVKRALNNNKLESIKNGDKTSTHLLSYSSNDKGFVVYPQIIEKNGKLKQFETDEEAYEYAMKNGEYIVFANEEDAKAYSENGLIKH